MWENILKSLNLYCLLCVSVLNTLNKVSVIWWISLFKINSFSLKDGRDEADKNEKLCSLLQFYER